MGEEKKDMGEVSDGYHTFNELYEHRHALMLVAMRKCPTSWFSLKHHDGSSIDGWFIAGLLNGEHQVTYHMPMRLLDAARKTGACERDAAPEWDGHTSADVIKRLVSYATREPVMVYLAEVQP